MSDTLSRAIPMNVEVTETQLVPIQSENPLAPPVNNVATASVVSGVVNLTYSCTITIPVEVNFDMVKAQQYYAGNQNKTLEFYFVYDYDGTLSGENNHYDVILTANGTKAPLAIISEVFSLIENIDPKTSRGTVTTVRVASE
jgi:hypothetical protein